MLVEISRLVNKCGEQGVQPSILGKSLEETELKYTFLFFGGGGKKIE